jgi:RNA polymerase sigma factor (sigma-70 family)
LVTMKKTPFSNEIAQEYQSLVSLISKQFHRKYKMVERDDIEQSLWLWFATHPNKIREWTKIGDKKQAEKLFARSLRNAASDYCQKEKAAQEGYSFDDNFFYTKNLVENILPYMIKSESDDDIDLEATLDLVMQDLGITQGGGSAAAEHGNYLAFFSDIKSAFYKLPEEKQNVLRLRYTDDLTYTQLADIINQSSNTARMKTERALNHLIRILGGQKPYQENDVVRVEEDEDAQQE